MYKAVSKDAQKQFERKYPGGAMAYRGIRLPKGRPQISSTWISPGNKGQMVSLEATPRKGRMTALHYAYNPAVAAPHRLYPGGQYLDDDQIVLMSFRIFADHILWNPTPEVVEHLVLRPDINLKTLGAYREERISVKAAAKELGY